jgi:SAM-dependent methyltransferase
MCFTNPRPDPASIAQFYFDDYSAPQKHHQPKSISLQSRSQYSNHFVPWHGQGRLLDFGCGDGAFLKKMHRRGWRVAGLDASGRVTQRLRDELGLPAFTGTLPHPDLEPESFDVITMWNSLERVHEPMPALREVRSLLASGGKVIITVPNIDSLAFRWFGRHWSGLELPRHLTHFTPGSLLEMLQRCGFATEPIRHVRRGDWLRKSARRSCQTPGNPPTWKLLLARRIPAWIVSWHAYWSMQCDSIMAIGHR